MKFVYVLLFATILTIAYATDILRTDKSEKRKLKSKSESTSKAQTRENGSGSWDTGYNCAGGILIRKGKEEYKMEGQGTFYAKKLEIPVTPSEQLGFCFKMKQSPGTNLKKIMVQTGNTDEWCFPYRLLSGDYEYTNPRFDFKTLNGRYTTDNNQSGVKETFDVKINLPYTTFGLWLINDEEGGKIRDLLNKRSTYRRHVVQGIKIESAKQGSIYVTSTKMYDETVQQAGKTSTAKTDAENDIKRLTTELSACTTDLSNDDLEIASIKSQISKLEINRGDIVRKLEHFANSKLQTQKTLTTLTDSAGNADKAKADLKKAVDSSTLEINAQFALLMNEAPTRDTDIVAAKSKVFTEGSVSGFQTSLNKVYP